VRLLLLLVMPVSCVDSSDRQKVGTAAHTAVVIKRCVARVLCADWINTSQQLARIAGVAGAALHAAQQALRCCAPCDKAACKAPRSGQVPTSP
jgi:hypothetical protein